jgi:signal transduction histidine kinase
VSGAAGVMRYMRFEGKSTIDVHKAISIQGVAHDITREVEVDRAKSEFVSLASHQLKTPLTAIGWLAEGLLSGDKGSLNAEQKKYVENIHTTDRQMMAMVNDLLNVSRIELGTLQLRPEDIAVHAFAQSVVDEQKVVAEEKHVQLTLNFEDNLPTMHADKNLLRMIFQNLLSNAIKYTPEGGLVTFAIARGGGTRDAIFLTVTDTGIGIPKDEQDKVFSKLHRAKNAQAKVPDGTGLGLYVIKTIIERIRGAITFESVENKGTTFFVTLPLIWEDSHAE